MITSVRILARFLPPKPLNQYGAVILDPPQSGVHPALIEKLQKAGPDTLIYVSCHPAALARDLKILTAYNTEQVIPVDLFPQTTALETIAVLKRQ